MLGDRYEIFSFSSPNRTSTHRHIHGGELTEGAFDDALRHSITKISHLHFVAAEDYHRRVIQLGEQPDNVFQVGGLGIDNILCLNLLTRSELEKS